MSQIFTGEGLGLNGSSIEALGGYGLKGQAAFGQAKVQVYINASNGNLVLQQKDGFLGDHNLAEELLQSYNAQGVSLSEGWEFNVGTRLSSVSGTVNQPGSSICRTDDAGHLTRFYYDAQTRCYSPQDGSIASLRYDGTLWHYRRGTDTVEWRYNTQGQLIEKQNRDGLTVQYAYESGRLTEICDSAGQRIVFAYENGRVTDIKAISEGTIVHHLRYRYDARGRLQETERALGEGKFYSIRYQYDGDSNRIQDVWQSDGTFMHIEYDTQGRVTLCRDGEGRAQHFAYGEGKTKIWNDNNEQWMYYYNPSGQLTGIEGPERFRIQYDYNDQHRLSRIIQGDHYWVFEYNSQGDCVKIIDETGKITKRTYDAHHQLLSETHFAQQASHEEEISVSSTYWIYDDHGHLQFHISPNGVVTEYRYDAQGNLIQKRCYLDERFSTTSGPAECPPEKQDLETWVQSQKSGSIDIADFEYNFRGQLTHQTRYHRIVHNDKASLEAVLETEYLYDAAGRLLEQSLANGHRIFYVYDDLDRLLFTKDNLGELRRIEYDDQHQRIITTAASGLQTIEIYDKSGLLLSSHRIDALQDFGTQKYRYDKAGRLSEHWNEKEGVTVYFYDEQGRRIAVVAPDGQVKEWRYDAYGNVITTRTCTVSLSMQNWGETLPEYSQIRPADHPHDPVKRYYYNARNQLQYEVSSNGAVLEYAYDLNGKVIAKHAYARFLDWRACTDKISSIQPVADKDDRITRFYYDAEGSCIASVDAESYVTEYEYDNRGLLLTTTRHYLQAKTGEWPDIRPEHHSLDIMTRSFYDEAGLKIADIDAEGYLTEYSYDAQGNCIKKYAYFEKSKIAPPNASCCLDAIRPPRHANDHWIQYQYNARNQRINEQHYNGLEIRYQYNADGQITKIEREDTRQQQTRALQHRYDSLGRVVASLDETGSKLLDELSADSQKTEEIWQKHAVHFQYDALGNITHKINQLGQITRYFYDAQNRLRYSIEDDGSVAERRYNDFGELAEDIRYAKRLENSAEEANTETLHQWLARIADSTHDEVTHYYYNSIGQIIRTAKGQKITNIEYNSFGEQSRLRKQIGGDRYNDTLFSYDRRGLRTQRIEDAGGLHYEWRKDYDSFGRILQDYTADQKILNRYLYDKKGNLQKVLNRVSGLKAFSYDAYDRKVSETAFGSNKELNRYEYDDRKGTLELHQLDGGTLITRFSAFGDTLSLTDANGHTREFSFNEKGERVHEQTADGGQIEYTYDDAGRLVWQKNNAGQTVRYTYDAADRLLCKTLDPEGLDLTTQYQYDGIGRQLRVTDGAGRLQSFEYDASGQLRRSIVDPDGLALVTEYEYDAAGNKILERQCDPQGIDRMKQYHYDALGRLVATLIDPDGLAIRTELTYDANGNISCKTDANGHRTYFLYDENNRCRYSLDANGALTEHIFDSIGNEKQTIHYTNRLDINRSYTIENIASFVIKDPQQDRLEYRLFDAQGRIKLQINAMGYATRYSYDAQGNITKSIQYAQRYKVEDNGRFPDPVDQSQARIQYYTYDTGNRLRFSVNGVGAVTEHCYDNSGLRVKTTRYSNAIALHDRAEALDNRFIEQHLKKDRSRDKTERYQYDAAGRLRYKMDAMGQVSEIRYDGSGNAIATIAYATPVSGDATNLANALQLSSEDRIQRSVFDAAGRERFRISPNGSVLERHYDAAGNVLSEIAHARHLSVSHYALANIEQFFATGDISDRISVFDYDTANRLQHKSNARHFQESYEYDPQGNLMSKTDAAKQVWTYTYDAANRMVEERSPQVTLSVYQKGQWQQQTRSVINAFVYDTFGNLIQTIKDKGFTNQTLNIEYDALNRAVKTLVKGVSVDASGLNTLPGRQETLVDLSTETVYDAFDQIRAEKDRAGHWRHYVYDTLGQQKYSIDSQGHVCESSYDLLGNRTSEIRYAEPTPFPKGHVWDSEDIHVQVSEENRVTYFSYDRNQRCIEKKGTALRYYDPDKECYSRDFAPTIRYQYNAFGECVAERQLRAADDWLETRWYYNLDGLKTACLNAERYLSTYRYDAFGECTEQTEYAQRVTHVSETDYTIPAKSAQDRTQTFTYDALGNLMEKCLKNVVSQRITAHGVENVVSDARTCYTYDGTGQRTSITDALGRTSYFYYDALGHVTAKIGPEAAQRRQAVVYGYDALGNTVLEKQLANGARAADTDRFILNAASAGDRVIQNLYDANNRLVTQIAANHSAVQYSYDANGNVSRTFRTVSDARGYGHLQDIRFQYDSEGRQCSRITMETDGTRVYENTLYNAFGEIVEKNFNGRFQSVYEYDTRGRVWRSNAEGFYQIFVYDLADNLTQVVRSSNSFQESTQENGIDLSAAEFAQVISFDKGVYCRQLQRCNNSYDKLGYLCRQVQVKMETVKEKTSEALERNIRECMNDRWGNVLIHKDALGNTTFYTYNAFDQIVKKQLPEVWVMDEHGKQTRQMPVCTYAYDVLGQCIAMQDANGHHVSRQYDAYGQIILETDALGFDRHKEYDLFGNLSQTYEGNHQHQTRFTYDANNQLTSIINAKGEQRRFSNDELGRRLTEENVTARQALIEKMLYEYDNRGNMVKKTDARGMQIWRTFDEANHLTSIRDAQQKTQSWEYDAQGRVYRHRDLSGKSTRYTYNTNGLLLSEQSQYGKDQVYHYNADGTLRQFEDRSLKQVTNYQYDANGNILAKESSQGEGNAIQWILETDYYTYDALGRICEVSRKNPDSQHPDATLFRFHYDYDAANNIRRIQSDVNYFQRSNVHSDMYFTYDANNRILINKGQLLNGDIQLSQTQGTRMHYHADGSLADATHYDNGHWQTYLYEYDDLGRTKQVSKYLDSQAQKATRLKHLEYDAAGHVSEEILYDAADNQSQINRSTYENGFLRRQYSYGAFNVLRSSVQYEDYDASGNLQQYSVTVYVHFKDETGYTTRHRLDYLAADSYQQKSDTARTDYTDGQYTLGKSDRQYDANGNLTRITDANGLHTVDYLNDAREGIRAKQEGHRRSSYLNVGGHNLADITLDETDGSQKLEIYAGFTPQGSARPAFSVPAFLAGGQTEGMGSLNDRLSVLKHTSLEEYQDNMAYRRALRSDADGTATNIPGDSFGSYTIQSGDTLRSIALAVYGDASLWYLIADANGIQDSNATAGQPGDAANSAMQLQPGTQLIIPAGSNMHFNNRTHKVYNPDAIYGDTSATTPVPLPLPPHHSKQHEAWKTLLVVVISTVAAILAGGIAATALHVLYGTSALAIDAASGFVAGFSGNIAGQMMAVPLGLQDDINVRSAFISGLMNAASACIGTAAVTTKTGEALGKSLARLEQTAFKPMSAATSMTADSAGQMIGMAFHQQRHFNWKELGVAGLASGISHSSVLKKLDGYGQLRDATFNLASQAAVHHGHADLVTSLGQAMGQTIAGMLNPVYSDAPDLKTREKDAQGNLILTEEDKEQLRFAQKVISDMELEPIDDGTNSNLVHIMVGFDGTWNDREQMENITNPAILNQLFDANETNFAIYEKGVGTDQETKLFGGAFGLGAKLRVFNAHEKLTKLVNEITSKNSEAEVVLTISGFSRGAAEAREFANYLLKKGIGDEASKVHGHYTQYLHTPRIGAMVLFDTVASMGVPGGDINLGYNLNIPKEAEHVLHLTANDESRLYFPLSSALNSAHDSDTRITQIGIPGVHSDIGGGYDNAYSRLALDLSYTYLKKLGIPLQANTKYPIPAVDDPALRLHDSRYILDQALQFTQRLYQREPHRTIYYANNPYSN